MGVVIVDEINGRATKLSTSLSLPCWITQLCREAQVPILVGRDVEMPATKKAITSALAPYVSLHAHIDDMEARSQQEWQSQEFLILVFEESKEDEPFIDLLGKQLKAAGKHPREGDEDESKSQKKKHNKKKTRASGFVRGSKTI
ncbi:hypothetical protein HAX54_031886 [Datura stramonium]|uniref:Uncharacterized protein n=1 Tax=Datura stramonium TaxID=4076 RepID=A0ABS8VD24_DATST|nr:hypothetical protein [Datura stramonium]